MSSGYGKLLFLTTYFYNYIILHCSYLFLIENAPIIQVLSILTLIFSTALRFQTVELGIIAISYQNNIKMSILYIYIV